MCVPTSPAPTIIIRMFLCLWLLCCLACWAGLAGVRFCLVGVQLCWLGCLGSLVRLSRLLC